MSSTENIDVQFVNFQSFHLEIQTTNNCIQILTSFWKELVSEVSHVLLFCKRIELFYQSLPFSSEVFTESKVEVKMRFFHLLLCCWVSASMAAVPVILDTDMDFDVDDVGALCVLHALQVRLLSWGNCLGLCLSHLRDWQGSLWGKADWSQTDSCSRILGRLSW